MSLIAGTLRGVRQRAGVSLGILLVATAAAAAAATGPAYDAAARTSILQDNLHDQSPILRTVEADGSGPVAGLAGQPECPGDQCPGGTAWRAGRRGPALPAAGGGDPGPGEHGRPPHAAHLAYRRVHAPAADRGVLPARGGPGAREHLLRQAQLMSGRATRSPPRPGMAASRSPGSTRSRPVRNSGPPTGWTARAPTSSSRTRVPPEPPTLGRDVHVRRHLRRRAGQRAG